MTPITYIQGDVTQPVGEGPKVVAHIVNDQGKWGRGVVVAIGRRWPEAREAYHDWYGREKRGEHNAGFQLGRVGFMRVRPSSQDGGIVVANMVAQRGIRNLGEPRAVSYDALEECLSYLGSCCSPHGGDGSSVHMPKIGCGLGGGDWEAVEGIIKATLVKRYNVPVYVYSLVPQR